MLSLMLLDTYYDKDYLFVDTMRQKNLLTKGNFLELLKYTDDPDEVVKELAKSIIEETDHDLFGLLVDESADFSDKEQMAVVFRFVDKNGIVKERFMGVTHVSETYSASLKSAIDSMFAKYGLSIQKVRGQGYDGASNMKGEFNGLRSLISKENTSTFYVHCFSHQLQLVVVVVAKKHFDDGDFFLYDFSVDECGGRNLMRLVEMFSSIIKVLEYVQDEGVEDSKRRQAHGLLRYFHSFEFVFHLQMMIHLLGLTDSLSMALQRRDQDILNVMSLVKSTKRKLQEFRVDGWNSLMIKISSFCEKHDIEKLNMDEDFVDSRKPRKKTGITNVHHYKLQEFNYRFNEVNTELLICAASYVLSIRSLNLTTQN
ncbi:unnamed protein product [Arabidopsis thaliana]|uniref:(thale cress) hypothetical protein n=1 Tax=Arabidopsis thaliana TaxID=3702 RepID=A0A7G2EMK4_ARATH|nr:unnamed protein product [Arabidopsis thaliana]